MDHQYGQRMRQDGRGADAWARTQPRFTLIAVFGLALVMMSVTGLIIDNTAPYLYDSDAIDEKAIDRGDLKDQFENAGGYANSMLDWPILAYILGIIIGAMLVVAELVPNLVVVQRAIRALLLAGAGVSSFLLSLAGLRFIGTYLISLMNAGETDAHAHIVPYFHIAAGMAFLIWSIVLLRGVISNLIDNGAGRGWLRGATRPAAIMLFVVSITLMVLPLLPHASTGSGDERQYLGEMELSIFAEFGGSIFGDNDLSKAGEHFQTARAMLWITFWASLGAFMFLTVERIVRPPALWGGLAQLNILLIVPIVVGLIFAILGTVKLFGIDEVNAGFNYFHFLASIGLLGGYALFITQVSIPYFKIVNEMGD